LAHHQVEAVVAPSKNATDEEIEEFYRDNAELISLLLGLVNANAYHPDQGAEIHRTYARNFWAGVEGERTEGHPFYRPPLKEDVWPPKSGPTGGSQTPLDQHRTNNQSGLPSMRANSHDR
jgi:hypothetical protein